jgi:toxin ParE1/3/4
MRYRRSALARGDLEDIWSCVARHASAETADTVIDRISDGFALLARHPHCGRRREDIAPSVRSFPIATYVVYYKAVAGAVVIARILHGSRHATEAEEAK